MHASEQLRALSTELAVLNSTKDRLGSAEAEKGLLKGDIARLVRVIETMPHSEVTKYAVMALLCSYPLSGLPVQYMAEDLSSLACCLSIYILLCSEFP
jgi:hypothetical protein